MKKTFPFLPVLLLAGCSGQQSALSHGGDGAAQIAQLSWLLFSLCTVIFTIVIAATWIAIRGPAKSRNMLSGTGAVVIGGIAFPAIVLTLLLGYTVWLMRGEAIGAQAKPALRVHVSGEQWWWRLSYEFPGEALVASANEIRLPVGSEIEFVLTSPDVIHSFWIPGLAGKVDMIPGRATKMRTKVMRPGIYRGQCAEYCGGPHAFMSMSVTAMPPAEFSNWFKSEASSALAPASDQGARGEKLFHAAGCGACHAVRGSAASGTIGPDLTHFGGRRSLGAELLPMSQENIARFIVDGQHLKPANKMPPFRIFSPEELGALSTYLAGLR